MLRIGVVAALAAAIGAPFAAELAGAPNKEIVVTRDSPTLPAGCSPRQVATLLVRFTDAFNRGDRHALVRFFPQQDPQGPFAEPAGTVFRWYSVSEGTARHVAHYDLEDLFRYFEQRHARGETLRMISVNVGTMDRIPPTAGAAITLRREASDLPAGLGPYAHGKAAIDCNRQRIFVWSIGQDDSREPRFDICPRPAGWIPAGPVLACTRTGSVPNAQELAPDFVLGTTRVPLPRRCRPSAVASRVESMLRSFNLGDADRFARGFNSTGQFHPYTASIRGSGFIGRSKIAAFVRKRYAAGDGWTAIALRPPSGAGSLDKAVYALGLHVTHQKLRVAEHGAKLVIDCRSGLLSAWVGPAISQPG